ncbi:MAG: DUF2569 domain-containing protein [Desulfopila sp.]
MVESHEQTKRAAGDNRNIQGIRGWLIFPALGLIIGPIIGAIGLVSALGMYADVARAGYGIVYMLELLVLMGLLLLTIYAALQFFRQKKSTAKVMIALYSISLATSLVLLLVELSVGPEDFVEESGKQLVRDIVAAAIWIPYFNVSKRVKATFVN